MKARSSRKKAAPRPVSRAAPARSTRVRKSSASKKDADSSSNDRTSERGKQQSGREADALAQYIALYEYAPAGYLTLGRDSVIIRANLAASRLLGVSRDSLTGRKLVRHMNDGDRAECGKALKRVFNHRSRESIEVELRRASGSTIVAHIDLAIEPRSKHCLAVLTDVTARHRQASALREVEQRSRRMLDDQTEVISRFKPDGTFTFVNEHYCRFFGKASDELIGRNWMPAAVKEDLPAIQSALEEMSPKNPIVVVENRVHAANGEVRWMQFVNRGTFDPQGKLLETQSVGRDTTERHLAEEELKENEERWKFALEGAGDGLWDWRVDTGDVVFSRQWKSMLGYEDHELANRVESWSSLVHPDDLPSALVAIKTHFDRRTPGYTCEFRMKCRDGSWKWILARGLVIERDAKGRPLRMIGTHKDNSALKSAKEREESNLRMLAEGAPCESVMTAVVRSIEAEHQGVVCAVFLADGTRTVIQEVCAPSLPKYFREALENARVSPDAPCGIAAAAAGRRLFVEHIAKERSWRGLEPVFARLKFQTCLSEPVVSSKNSVFGAITMFWRSHHTPNAAEISSLTSAASLIAIAIERRLSEEALRDRELRHRGIMDSKLVGLMYWRLDGTITDANDAFLQMIGYTRDELNDGVVSWSRMTPPELRELDARAMDELLARGFITPYEKEYIRKDGSRVPVILGGVLFTHQQDEGVSFVLDITDRKRAERALKESEDRYAHAMRGTNDGLWDWNMVTGKTYLSAQWKALLGFSNDELPSDREMAFRARLHPDDVATVNAALNAHLKQRKPYDLEVRLMMKDETYRWFRVRGSAAKDENGRAIRMAGSMSDITLQKQADAAYKRELHFKEALVRHTAALILVTDTEGRVLDANPAFTKVLGYTLKSIKGRSAWEVGMMDEIESARSRERFSKLAAGFDNPPAEARLRTKSGDIRIVEIWGTFSPDPSGKVERIVVTGIDITDRVRLQSEVLKVVEQEHARIGHDLHDGVGQTMTGIATLLEALESSLQGPQKTQAGRIRELVQQSVQEVRRMSHGIAPAGVKHRGLGGALRLLAETVRNNYRTQCSCEIDPDIPLADSDMQTHLFRIAQEAVNNAMRHGRPKRVDLALKRVSPLECKIEIKDDGVGFKQRDKTSNGGHAEDEGIGVRVMDYRASLIGGRLEIRSRGKGGVIVTCRFPCANH